MRRRSATSNRPIAEAMTTAASAVFGRFWSRFGREQQQQRDRERAHDPRQLRPGARRLGHRRARRAAADREALEEAGREVGDAEADHLLVRVDRRAQTRRIGSREHARVGERHEGDRDAAHEDRHEVVDVDRAEGAASAVPAADGPSTDTPDRSRDRRRRPATVAATTAIRMPGTRGQRFRTRISASVPAPIASADDVRASREHLLDDCPRLAQRSARP